VIFRKQFAFNETSAISGGPYAQHASFPHFVTLQPVPAECTLAQKENVLLATLDIMYSSFCGYC